MDASRESDNHRSHDRSGEADLAQVRLYHPVIPDPVDLLIVVQAFKEMSKGEATASAMERSLTSIEKKIDELLAQAEENIKAAKDGDTAAAELGSSSEHARRSVDEKRI